jgi:signal transduction histidine kinase
MRAEVAPRSIQIRLENPPPELRIPADPNRLTHVFYNLLQNAQDAMPGGGVVQLRFRVADGEVTTEIEDDGPGIAPEVAQGLFEPFVTQGKPHAAGLGLSICKRIVEDHHGRIAARSGAGRGAVFTVTLPITS